MDKNSNKMALDGKDLAIIRELSRNSAQTAKELSRKLGLPPTTVHNRIARLEREGVIRGYAAKIDYAKVGKPLAAFINITVDYKRLEKSQHDTAGQIACMEGVEEASIVTGETDLVVKLHVASPAELDSFLTRRLRKIPGVDRTVSWVVLNDFECRAAAPLKG